MRKWLAFGIQVPFVAMMWVACSGDDTTEPTRAIPPFKT